MARGRRQPQEERQTRDGLPADLRLYSPFPFKGINQKASSIAVNDNDFVWLENVIWIGEGQLAFGLSNNPVPIYTAPLGLTIVSYPGFHFGTTKYLAVFLSDGSAVAVNLVNGAITNIASAGTFSVTTPPCVAPYASTGVGINPYLLIGTSNAYYVWDGSSLYQPGSLAPQVIVTSGGFSYTSAPTVTIAGGLGSGASAVATISNGSVVSIQLTNPGSGYGPFDQGFLNVIITGGGSTNKLAQGTATIGGGGVTSVQVLQGGLGYTSNPSVTFTGGGGSGAAALGVLNGPTVVSVLEVNPGTGYTSTPSVAFTGGSPTTAATGIAIIGTNGITSITVTDGGSGYLSTPTVVITDPYGSGVGAVAYAAINAGVVTGVTITNPGANYQGAVVRFVGGNPAVAAATVNLMPQGGSNPISGVAIQVFKNRVWLINNTFRYTTATGSVSNFSASAGGVISQNNDNNLIYQLEGLAQSSGFLYEFGDSSVNAISNPQTTVTNNVASTSYTVTNVDPQIGCLWPGTIQAFGNAIVFATPLGVYGVYGSTLRKISNELDDLFAVLPAMPQLPTAAIVVMFNIKFYAISIFLTDPLQQVNRQLILLWDGFRWFVATQDAAVTSLVTVGTGGYYVGYGSDTKHIYQCFSQPSATLFKKIVSKFYGVESAQQFKQALRFYLSAEQPFSYDITIHTEISDVHLGSVSYPGSAGPAANNAYGSRLTVLGQDAQGANGRFLGWTLSSGAPSNNIDYMALGYRYYSAYYS